MNTVRSKKMIIVCILEILRKYSDENHRLKQREIVDLLDREYGITVDRKAVQRNLRDLIECDEFGIEYVEIPRGSSTPREGEESSIMTQIYMAHDLTDSEFQLLTDSILFSRNITASQAEQLIEKIRHSVSTYTAEKTKQIHLSKTVSRTAEQNTFLNIEKVREALEGKRQIRIVSRKYCWDDGFKTVPGESKIVTPYYLTATNGFYYLICLNEETKETEGIRIDRIEEIVITTEAGTPLQETEFRNTTLDRYLRTHPFLSAGRMVSASLKIAENALSDLFDTFGDHFTVSLVDSGFLTISLRCGEEDLFRWALLHSDIAEILAPQYLRNRLRTETENLWKRYITTDEDQVDAIIQSTSDRNGNLVIQGRDLTGQMEKIPPNTLHHVDLRRNTGCNMSFLKEQSELVSLTVFNQPFNQPELLLRAKKLQSVRLINTGIKDVSVLGRIPTLQDIVLSERDAEGIPGIENLKGKHVILLKQFAIKQDIQALMNMGIDIKVMSHGQIIGVTRETIHKL